MYIQHSIDNLIENLHNLCSSPNIRMMEWVAFVAHVGEVRNVHKIFVRKTLKGIET